jgi:hypothetical protein
MKKTLVIFLVAFWLSACAPSVQAVQTAIAQTQAANPTPTVPAHLLVLQKDLAGFLLLNSDLPIDGQYRRFAYSPFSNPNKNVNSAYVEETGRMDGWEVYYTRSSNSASVPQEIHGMVVLYKENAGARKSINKYSDDLVTDFGYLEEILAPGIGDDTRAFILRYQKEPRGSALQISYWIEFSYQNIVEVIRADGTENEVQPELIDNIARLVLARLQANPGLNP